MALALIMISQFILVNYLNQSFLDNLVRLQLYVPNMFNRFRFLLLGYTMMRERILYNNSMKSYDTRTGYANDLDRYMKDKSVLIDEDLIRYRKNVSSVSQILVDHLNV